MKLSFSATVEYVRDLIPTFATKISPSDNPNADAAVLSHIAAGRVFFTTANNGLKYLYVFPCNPEYFELAKYIMRSNGLKPRTHLSRFFHGRTPTLRVPYQQIKKNENAILFARSVINVSAFKKDITDIKSRIDILQQKMK